jgi:CBS domain-containing protein
VTTAVDTVPASITLHGAVAFLTSPTTIHPSFPVVDGDNRVISVIDPPSVLRWRRLGMHRKTTLRRLLAGGKIVFTYPDEYLDSLAERLLTVNISHLPVVSREDGRLVGYIGWRDLMQVRAKRQAEEQQRTTFFRTPRATVASRPSAL